MIAVAIPGLIILALIFANGVFVAAEFAIVAISRPRIKRMAEAGSGSAKRILNIINDPERQNLYITTAQVGITIASLGLGMYGENVLADLLVEKFISLGSIADPLAHTLATLVAVGILTYFHVVIGEMIPKSLALQSSIKTTILLARPISIVEKIFGPIIWVLNKASFGIMRILGIDLRDSQSKLFTPSELEYVVARSSMSGLMDESEKIFVENIFDLRERTAEQAMTPRNRVAAVSVNSSMDELFELACREEKTRYPIYDGNIDNILGVLHIKDLIRYSYKEGGQVIDLRKLMRPTLFISERLTLLETLSKFRNEKIQMAVVVDEFGGTAGIVTLEDLIEEVVGEIQDEFDEEIVPIEEISEGVIRVRGDVILDELNQHYNLGLEHAEAITIGGLVMAELGEIPEGGEEILYAGIKIRVMLVENHSVKRVVLTLPKK